MRVLPVVTATLLLSFMVGFFIAESERPPYGLIFNAYDAVRRNPAVDAIYDRVRMLMGDPVQPDGQRRLDQPLKHWNPAPEIVVGAGTDAQDLRDAREAVDALAYLQSYEKAPVAKSVTHFDPDRTQPGLNFYTTGSGAAAYLVDMEGNLLHKWAKPYEEALPNFSGPLKDGRMYWFYAWLFPNGDIIAIYPRTGIVRLDKDSNVIWATEGDHHHTFDYDPASGTITALKRSPPIPSSWDEEEETIQEYMTVLDAATGKILSQIDLVAAIEDSPYAGLIRHAPYEKSDRLHPNTVQILDGRFAKIHPAFRKGNILTSFRNIDTIGVIDYESGLLIWAMTGAFDGQHRPTFRTDGTILVFSNKPEHGQSEIIALDPLTQERVWSYTDEDFFTQVSGVAWPLSNGNVLGVEAQAGRAFEVAPDGELVWEFYTPERRGENNEMIPTLFEMYRYPADHADSWLDRD